MTVTSYAAKKALGSGPAADRPPAELDGTGVVGLNLAVGPLRRPFAAKAPLLGPGDWAGATFTRRRPGQRGSAHGDPGDRGRITQSLRSPPCMRTASRARRMNSRWAALQTSHPTCLTATTG
jgi:hypothetical protein